jgi:polyhydroxyalkanoate synthesis regulator phasin
MSDLLNLAGHENQTIAWGAQQALQIQQQVQSGAISAQEGAMLAEDLKQQVNIAMAADSIENKVLIDSAISGLLTVLTSI